MVPFPDFLRLLDVLKALIIYHDVPLEALLRPEPGHAGLEYAHADRMEVLPDERLTLLRRKLRVADLKVAPRDEHSLLKEVEGDKA